MKYYAVLDTNVVVSAFLKRGSIPDTVLSLALNNVITLLLNEEIVKEYREVLLRPKFGFDEKDIEIFIKQIESQGIFINEHRLADVFPDPNDKVFYEIVMEAKKDREAYLVTGNLKHFPQQPYVVTPREMLEIIVRDNID